MTATPDHPERSADDPTLRTEDDRAADYVDPEVGAHAPAQERRQQPAGPSSAPDQRPGPLKPGETDPDTPKGFASFERPGVDGNWQDAEPER